jgi:hypothetical protein
VTRFRGHRLHWQSGPGPRKRECATKLRPPLPPCCAWNFISHRTNRSGIHLHSSCGEDHAKRKAAGRGQTKHKESCGSRQKKEDDGSSSPSDPSGAGERGGKGGKQKRAKQKRKRAGYALARRPLSRVVILRRFSQRSLPDRGRNKQIEIKTNKDVLQLFCQASILSPNFAEERFGSLLDICCRVRAAARRRGLPLFRAETESSGFVDAKSCIVMTQLAIDLVHVPRRITEFQNVAMPAPPRGEKVF